MNIFKEMALSVYSYKSYGQFLRNKKGKVFGFSVVLMTIYFVITIVIPFARFQMKTGGIAAMIEENVPDFELSDGLLWVDKVIEYQEGGTYFYIDTDPAYALYDVDEIEAHLYNYYQVILMDSEKIIIKNNGEVQGAYFSDLDLEFSRDKLVDLVPFAYAFILIGMIIAYLWMMAMFFLGVLILALIGMIAASCMKCKFTFGQLYILGIYSRTLPLLIKAILSFMPFHIPFFNFYNVVISVLIIIYAIQKIKEQEIQRSLEY